MIKENRNTSGRDDRDAGMVEYALLLALIVFVCSAALTYFGTENDASLDRS